MEFVISQQPLLKNTSFVFLFEFVVFLESARSHYRVDRVVFNLTNLAFSMCKIFSLIPNLYLTWVIVNRLPVLFLHSNSIDICEN